MTRLYDAAFDADLEKVKFLLNSGYSPNEPTDTDYWSEFPINAVIHGYGQENKNDCLEKRLSIMKLLIDSDANIVTSINIWQRTPLHLATFYNIPAMIKLLLEHNDDVLDDPDLFVNMRDRNGDTPLHILTNPEAGGLTLQKHTSAYLLLKSGANLFALNNCGRSPGSFIWEQNNTTFKWNKKEQSKECFENRKLHPSTQEKIFSQLLPNIPIEFINFRYHPNKFFLSRPALLNTHLKPLSINHILERETEIPIALRNLIRNSRLDFFDSPIKESSEEKDMSKVCPAI